MIMSLPGFIGQTYSARSPVIDVQECINLYPEFEDANSKERVVFIGTPGLSYFTKGTNNLPNRGIYTTSTGRMFSVNGNSLDEIINATATARGDLFTTTGYCKMADNGQQLMLVDGVHSYLLDLSTNEWHTHSTDSQLPTNCSHVVFLDGVFVVNEQTKFQYNLLWSNLYDGLTWTGTDVATPEGSPDKLLSIETANNNLWLIGPLSTEVFYDTGFNGVNFARIQGALTNIGTSAQYSVVTNGNTVYWLGANTQGINTVWAANSFTPQRISTHAIEFMLSKMLRVDDCIAYCYQQEGHKFYVMNFPSGNKTLVYDELTNMWHERRFYNSTSNIRSRHLGNSYCFYNGNHYVADFSNSNIYKMDLSIYMDNDNMIERIRTTPHIHKDRKRLFFHELEIDLQRGVSLPNDVTMGNGTGGKDTRVGLQWSDDGGMTWSGKYYHSLGKRGNYIERTHWHRLGHSRDRIFRISFTDPIPLAIVDGIIDVEVG
jgi:hypothetical protein